MRYPKTKLLHVVNRFGVGGSERQQTELIRRLPPERYDQVVASMEKEGRFLGEVEERGVEVFEFPMTSFYNRGALRQYRALARLMRQRKIQLVHCHDFYSNIFGTISARLAGLSKIITSRRDTGERCTFMQRLMQRIAYSFSAAVITNADALKQILVRKEFVPGRKIRRVYNTVDFTRFFPKEPPPQLAASLSLPAHAPVIGIVSSLRPEKDHKTFIRAAIEIRKVRPNGRFLIVGDGAMREELERFTREHDMADAVVFTGDRLDVPDVLALMDVCVLTSRNEGLSNAIIEAMACARPIVATDVGGTRELVADGQTGFLIQPQDHANLAERVLRILDDPALASKLGELARKKALENFSPDVFLPNVEALYASVLNQEQRFAGTCEREGRGAT